MDALEFHLVDVFAARPLSGNGLTIVFAEPPLDARLMQALTIELRQFETIFLTREAGPSTGPSTWRARVFTMEEELDFAGHPAIGAAAQIHHLFHAGEARATITLRLNRQSVTLDSEAVEGGYHATMHQQAPNFLRTLAPGEERALLAALGIDPARRVGTLPMEVVTTGLAYLIVPVDGDGLAGARISGSNLEAHLAAVGARFAYLLDAHAREGRTWDNLGRVEDIATGSAAGPAGAYLVRHGLAQAGAALTIEQGRFVGRPSKIEVLVSGHGVADIGGIAVSGEVRLIASGRIGPLAI